MRLTFLWIVLTTIMNFLSTWYKYPWFLATPGGWHLLFWVKKLDEWIDCHHVWYRHSCSLDQLILPYTSWNCRFSRLWTCVEDRGTPDCSYIGLEWVLFSVWTTYHFPQWVQVWPAVFVLLGTLFRSVCERYCTWHVGWFRVMWVFVLFMCRAYRFVLDMSVYPKGWDCMAFFCFVLFITFSHIHIVFEMGFNICYYTTHALWVCDYQGHQRKFITIFFVSVCWIEIATSSLQPEPLIPSGMPWVPSRPESRVEGSCGYFNLTWEKVCSGPLGKDE